MPTENPQVSTVLANIKCPFHGDEFPRAVYGLDSGQQEVVAHGAPWCSEYAGDTHAEFIARPEIQEAIANGTSFA